MRDDVLLFLADGFAAQAIDGALHMVYGVTATAMLLSLGTAPSVASASVHAAEVFTTSVPGVVHWQLRSILRAPLSQLALSGGIGGVR